MSGPSALGVPGGKLCPFFRMHLPNRHDIRFPLPHDTIPLNFVLLRQTRGVGMTELTLISPSVTSIKPLVEAALHNEVCLLEAGLRQTQHRLHQFEEQYAMATDEFIKKQADNGIQETLETIEWLGEYRMVQRIQEKIDALKGIQFAN